MNNLRLPKKDSSTFRGLVTSAQGFFAVLFVLGTGLIGVIKGVPGCGEAVATYLQDNAIQYAVVLGLPAGLVSFVMNVFLRKEVKTY